MRDFLFMLLGCGIGVFATAMFVKMLISDSERRVGDNSDVAHAIFVRDKLRALRRSCYYVTCKSQRNAMLDTDYLQLKHAGFNLKILQVSNAWQLMAIKQNVVGAKPVLFIDNSSRGILLDYIDEYLRMLNHEKQLRDTGIYTQPIEQRGFAA